jgi:hypothetical protein
MIESNIGEAGRGTLNFRIQPRITRGSAVQGAKRSALVKNARPDHGRNITNVAALNASVVQNSESMLLMIGFHKNSQKLNTQKIRSVNDATKLIQFFGSIARQKCLTLKCSIFTPPPVLASGGSTCSICRLATGAARRARVNRLVSLL